MKKVLFILAILALLTTHCAGETPTQPVLPAATAATTQITFMGLPGGTGYEIDQSLIETFTRQTGIKVTIVPGPETATERLEKYLELLNAQSAQPDVYQIDTTWPALLADDMLDLTPYVENQTSSFFPAMLENDRVDGRLVALPFYTDLGVLFYRTDLLEKYGYSAPPRTWDELQTMAAHIQEQERNTGKPDFWGFVFQAALHEGLTCNALEWQVSEGGGQIIEPNGTISVNNPLAAAALARAASWVGTIAPPGVTVYRAEDSRNIFQAGNAAFMRNWPNHYALLQAEGSPVKDLVGIAPLPAGSARSAAALGGWQLAVSKYSAYPQAAAEFVAYMTSATVQQQRALKGAYLPSLPDLYDQPEMMQAGSIISYIQDRFFESVVARPSNVSGLYYPQVSKAYFTAVHSILTGEIPAGEALAGLEKELMEITGLKSGLP